MKQYDIDSCHIFHTCTHSSCTLKGKNIGNQLIIPSECVSGCIPDVKR